jgi:hypothetical protein
MLELDELMKLHDKAYDSGYDTRLKAADDMVFAWVSQWDDTYLSQSDIGYRGEFNILRKAMRQILTDLTLNPVQVDFDPVDATDASGADLMDGMYRADMRNNTSLEAKKNANQEAVACGVAAWELRAEWKTNNPDDDRQVIKRWPLYEANNNVMWDPNAKLLDKSDATYVSCLVAYSDDGYKALREELTGESEESGDASFKFPEISYVFPWISEANKIYVTRFFHRELKKVKHFIFVDGFGTVKSVAEHEMDDKEDFLADNGYDLTDERTINRYVVTRYIASGGEILEAVVIAGEHIPIVPQYGERQFVEGEEHYEGIVRLAKDPQRLRNFQLSYLADIVSMSPREKPIFTAEQIQGFEDMYEQSGADNNLPYLLQNALDSNGQPLPVGAVGGIKAPDVPPALMMSIAESRVAVDDVAGAGLPQDITDTHLSGKAVQALQKRMDMQSYTYQDNHKFAMRRDGEIYASMARDIHDVQQDVTLVRVDGTKSKETINKEEMNYDTFEREISNDISKMAFDVYANVGPSFESVKEQNKEELKELINGVPAGSTEYIMLLNEYFMLIDGTSFKDIRDYGRKQLILAGVKEPETDEEKAMVAESQQSQQPQVDPAMMLAAQAEMLKAQNQQQELGIKVKAQEIEMARLQQEGYKISLDEQTKAAGIGKTKAETINTMVKTQQLSTQTQGQRIDNMQKLTPQVTAA